MLRISSHKTRTLFLETFTKELILNSNSKETPEKILIEEVLKKPAGRGIASIMREIPVVKKGGGTGRFEKGGIGEEAGGISEGGISKSSGVGTSGIRKVGGLGLGISEGGIGWEESGGGTKISEGEINKISGTGGIGTGKGEEISKLSEEQKIGVFWQMPKETSPENIILKQKLTQGGPIRPYILPLSIESQKIQAKFTKQTLAPALLPAEGEVNLGKLNLLSKDKAVTMIECAGPGKFIIIKRAGQIKLTKITLAQEEINGIIENFSERARIPIVGGVFKVSVENLTITAVISEFVGSRFIIYKSSPYSLIS